MSRRRRNNSQEDAEVPMSPLIDCVFLLLIFFLVTTIIKRKEKLIPIVLPDMSSQISSEVKDETIIIGLDINGNTYKSIPGTRDHNGELKYQPLLDFNEYLKGLVSQYGESAYEKPLRIDADRYIEFQDAIKILDICKLEGFTNVSIRSRQRKL